MKIFAENLKKLRKENKLTQAELAELFCCHFNTISAWENNKQEPDFETIVLISQYFDVSVDFLFGKADF